MNTMTNPEPLGSEKPDFENLSGDKQVYFFNRMVEELLGLGDVHHRKVAQFHDKDTAAKRCEATWSSLLARRESAKAVDQGRGKDVGTEVDPEKVKPSAAPEKKETAAEQEDDMAKKAKAKKTPAKKAAKAAKVTVKKPEKELPTGIVGEFKQRAGGFREKLLLAMHERKNKQLPLKELALKVYGRGAEGNPESAVLMVMKGLEDAIKNNRLPWKIVKEVDSETKTRSYGLHAK